MKNNQEPTTKSGRNHSPTFDVCAISMNAMDVIVRQRTGRKVTYLSIFCEDESDFFTVDEGPRVYRKLKRLTKLGDESEDHMPPQYIFFNESDRVDNGCNPFGLESLSQVAGYTMYLIALTKFHTKPDYPDYAPGPSFSAVVERRGNRQDAIDGIIARRKESEQYE
jgi:hypothetical protein